MPQTKLAAFRYRVLDELFRNYPSGLTINELVKKVSEKLDEFHGISTISSRSLKSDIQVMRRDPPAGFAAPIEIPYGTGRYRYSDPSFSIMKSLSEMDIKNIQQSVQVLSQFKELPHFAFLEEMLMRIEGGVNQSLFNEGALYFDHEPVAKGGNWVTPIINAIHTDLILEINYQSYGEGSEKEKIRKVHPYFLKKYRTRWYLVAYVETTDRLENLALDRINSIEPCGSGINKSYKPDPNNFYNNVIGVTHFQDSPLTNIILRAGRQTWPFIGSLPLHHSQELLKEDDHGVVFRISIKPNMEFEALVLRYGENLEVLEPEHLRQKIATRVEKMYQKYNRSVKK